MGLSSKAISKVSRSIVVLRISFLSSESAKYIKTRISPPASLCGSSSVRLLTSSMYFHYATTDVTLTQFNGGTGCIQATPGHDIKVSYRTVLQRVILHRQVLIAVSTPIYRKDVMTGKHYLLLQSHRNHFLRVPYLFCAKRLPMDLPSRNQMNMLSASDFYVNSFL